MHNFYILQKNIFSQFMFNDNISTFFLDWSRNIFKKYFENWKIVWKAWKNVGSKDYTKYVREGEGGDIGLIITLVPKVPNLFLIRWLHNFRDIYLILIGWFIKFSVQTFQTLIVIYKRGILCIIIGDVFHFIGHCVIS